MMLLIGEVLLGLCVLGLLVGYAIWQHRERKRLRALEQQRLADWNHEIVIAYGTRCRDPHGIVKISKSEP